MISGPGENEGEGLKHLITEIVGIETQDLVTTTRVTSEDKISTSMQPNVPAKYIKLNKEALVELQKSACL